MQPRKLPLPVPADSIPWEKILPIADRSYKRDEKDQWRKALLAFLASLRENSNRPTAYSSDVYQWFDIFNARLKAARLGVLLLVSDGKGGRAFCSSENRPSRIALRAETQDVPWEEMFDALSHSMTEERQVLERLRENGNQAIPENGSYRFTNYNARLSLADLPFRLLAPAESGRDMVCVCHKAAVITEDSVRKDLDRAVQRAIERGWTNDQLIEYLRKTPTTSLTR